MSTTFPNSAGGDEPTYDDLYERAQELDIDGRSDMNKEELAAAVEEAEATGGDTAPADATATDEGATAGPEDLPEGAPQRTDTATPVGPGAGAVPRSAQPDHTPDEEGYVGVDPIYRNASTTARQPAKGEGENREVTDRRGDGARRPETTENTRDSDNE